MSMQELEDALRMIADHPDRGEFVGPREEGLIAEAESRLGVEFPPTFRAYVRALGAGYFGASLIFGVIDDQWDVPANIDAVWQTLDARRNGWLPDNLVVVYNDGTGTRFVLNLTERRTDGEAPVVAWHPGFSKLGQKLELIAPDFGAFLLEEVTWELEE